MTLIHFWVSSGDSVQSVQLLNNLTTFRSRSVFRQFTSRTMACHSQKKELFVSNFHNLHHYSIIHLLLIVRFRSDQKWNEMFEPWDEWGILKQTIFFLYRCCWELFVIRDRLHVSYEQRALNKKLQIAKNAKQPSFLGIQMKLRVELEAALLPIGACNETIFHQPKHRLLVKQKNAHSLTADLPIESRNTMASKWIKTLSFTVRKADNIKRFHPLKRRQRNRNQRN